MYKDQDIRPILIRLLQKCNNKPGTLIVEEFGLCQGQVRADVAVINGSINAYEIKSDKDTLKRLPEQKKAYNKIFDFVTLVTTEKHLKKTAKVIPKWWGIDEAVMENGVVHIYRIRNAEINNGINPNYLVQLLWRDEALELLKRRSLHKGISSKPRDVLWKKIVENLTIEDLKNEVKSILKIRSNWRSGPIHRSSGD